MFIKEENNELEKEENKKTIKFGFDRLLSGISVLSLVIFWIMSVPMHSMGRFSKSFLYPFYIFIIIVLIVYFAVAVVKILNKLSGNKLNVQFLTPLSVDLLIILFGTMILLTY